MLYTEPQGLSTLQLAFRSLVLADNSTLASHSCIVAFPDKRMDDFHLLNIINHLALI